MPYGVRTAITLNDIDFIARADRTRVIRPAKEPNVRTLDIGDDVAPIRTITAVNLSDGTTTKTVTEILAGGGGSEAHLYLHFARFTGTNIQATIQFYNNDPTDYATLETTEVGAVGTNLAQNLVCSGSIFVDGVMLPMFQAKFHRSGETPVFRCYYQKTDGTTTGVNITTLAEHSVTQIY